MRQKIIHPYGDMWNYSLDYQDDTNQINDTLIWTGEKNGLLSGKIFKGSSLDFKGLKSSSVYLSVHLLKRGKQITFCIGQQLRFETGGNLFRCILCWPEKEGKDMDIETDHKPFTELEESVEINQIESYIDTDTKLNLVGYFVESKNGLNRWGRFRSQVINRS